MKNVLVIGGSGFLGSAVISELIRVGYKVYATQNNSQLKNAERISVIKGGINRLNAKVLREIRPEVIYHCARPTVKRLRRLGRKLAALKAAQLNKRLLQQIEISGITPKLVFASGSLVYGSSDKIHNENTSINPTSYAKQYVHGEFPIVNKSLSGNYPVYVLRFPWLLGIGSWFSWFYLQNIKETGTIPLFGKGLNHMSVVSLKDAAGLMVKYSEHNLGSGVYNIFSPIILTQLEFTDAICDQYKCKVVDYKEIYPHDVEIAAKEAFTSNIIMRSNYPDLLNKYEFQDLHQILREIKTGVYF